MSKISASNLKVHEEGVSKLMMRMVQHEKAHKVDVVRVGYENWIRVGYETWLWSWNIQRLNIKT